MAEDQSGVTVHVVRGNNRVKDTYPKAAGIRVEESHLLVVSSNVTQAIAIYAPGKWEWAEVHG